MSQSLLTARHMLKSVSNATTISTYMFFAWLIVAILFGVFMVYLEVNNKREKLIDTGIGIWCAIVLCFVVSAFVCFINTSYYQLNARGVYQYTKAVNIKHHYPHAYPYGKRAREYGNLMTESKENGHHRVHKPSAWQYF